MTPSLRVAACSSSTGSTSVPCETAPQDVAVPNLTADRQAPLISTSVVEKMSLQRPAQKPVPTYQQGLNNPQSLKRSAGRTASLGVMGAVAAGVLALLFATNVAVQEILFLVLIFAVAYLWQTTQRLTAQVELSDAKAAAERKGRTNAERMLLEQKGKNRQAPKGGNEQVDADTHAEDPSADGSIRRSEPGRLLDTVDRPDDQFLFRPIGYAKSPYLQRCGTPRQSGICPSVVTEVKLVPCLNAAACLDGLAEYSHLWVSYIFHKNTNLCREDRALLNRREKGSGVTKACPAGDDDDEIVHNSAKSAVGQHGVCQKEQVDRDTNRKTPPPFQGLITKILPPRGSKKVGIFACRSPHRPNPLGLSLARIERIDAGKGVLVLSGLDLVDGTPVVDVKPYLPQTECKHDAVVPGWVRESYAVEKFQTTWNNTVIEQLTQHVKTSSSPRSHEVAEAASQAQCAASEVEKLQTQVEEVLAMDIRSPFQRDKHHDAVFRGSLRFDRFLFEYTLQDEVNNIVTVTLLSDETQNGS
ncbi:unnamed protein product [Amoebophrya sp. A120]|nr:unnamed protein product [Amoebophrya sp. A120]|eukprot:GSA120T00019042001.1